MKFSILKVIKINGVLKISFIHSNSNKSETVEHFFTKLMVYKLLLERGHEVSLEFYINGTGVMDVFDRTTGVVYEIEPTKQKADAKWRQFKLYTGVKEVVIVPYNEIMVKMRGQVFQKHSLNLWRSEVEKHLVG